MKICIFGAGAIGGYMGAKLALAGADVSLVARGPHLAAIQDTGLTLVEEGAGPVHVPVRATSDPAELGPQDYVIVTLKAHSVPGVVGAMQPLIGDQTTIVSGVNGVPWWYFHKIGGPLEGTRLASVDPGDAQWLGFGPDRVLGCVVYPAAEVSEPGVIHHIEGNRFSLGEPDGSKSERAERLSAADVETLCLLDAFGALIANTDRHHGNISLLLHNDRWQLAPAYDMLPMLYAPVAGEIVPRNFAAQPPRPTVHTLQVWPRARELAQRFWQTTAQDPRISAPFRELAQANERLLAGL